MYLLTKNKPLILIRCNLLQSLAVYTLQKITVMGYSCEKKLEVTMANAGIVAFSIRTLYVFNGL